MKNFLLLLLIVLSHKTHASLSRAWAVKYANGHSLEYVKSAVNTGNVFVLFRSIDGGGDTSYVKAYSPTGALLWTYEMPDVYAWDMVVDSLSRVVVSGTVQATSEFYLLGTDKNGNQLFENYESFPFYFSDARLAADNLGKFFVAFTKSSYAWEIRKYDLTGGINWARQINFESTPLGVNVFDLKFKNGVLCILGSLVDTYTDGSGNPATGLFIHAALINPNNTTASTPLFHLLESIHIIKSEVQQDVSGNCYFIIDNEVRRYAGAGGALDYANQVTDPLWMLKAIQNDILCITNTGYLRLNSSGIPVYNQTLTTPEITSVTVGTSEVKFFSPQTGNNVFAINPTNGVFQFSQSVTRGLRDAYDYNGVIYKCGQPAGDTIMIEKYDVASEVWSAPGESSLVIYPNPFSAMVYWNSTSDFTRYEIYNVEGRLVKAENLNGDKSINCEVFGSGIYLLKLIATDGNIYQSRLIRL